MAPSFEEILLSEQFTFYIGEEKKPIAVHASAIAATSKPMSVLINGHMSEAQTRSAEIKEIQVDDFVRFCEYAYRGDYTVPSCVIEDDPPKDEESAPPPILQEATAGAEESSVIQFEIEPVPAEPEYDVDSWFGTSSKKKKGKKGADVALDGTPSSRKSILQRQIFERQYLGKESLSSIVPELFVPQGNTSKNQNFTTVFLAHARLYAFASLYLIDSLKALTLHKLQQTLKSFQLYQRRIADVLALARYAYNNDDVPCRSDDGSIDDLRRLVVEYIAYRIEKIGPTKKFRKLIEEGGEFVGDFWEITRVSYL